MVMLFLNEIQEQKFLEKGNGNIFTLDPEKDLVLQCQLKLKSFQYTYLFIL